MGLESTLAVLNQMQDVGTIGQYAIGGPVAAFLYVEPGTTFDLDVFLLWERGDSGSIDFGPIYDHLETFGYVPAREGIMVEGWEVQFLPSNSALEKEALAEGVPIEIGGVPTRIFTKEHLMAICLQTGRPKDFGRLVQFLQEGQPDKQHLMEILNRHDLEPRWEEFLKRFQFDP